MKKTISLIVPLTLISIPLQGKITLNTPTTTPTTHKIKNAVPLDGKHTNQLPFYTNNQKQIAESLDELFRKASQAISKNNLDEAIELYNRIVKEYPSCAQGYLNLGVILAEQGRYLNAIENYKKAESLNPQYKKAILYMAQAYKALHEYEEAIEYYIKALELDPGLTEAHKDLSHLLTEQERFSEAIEHLQAALNNDPGNMHLTFELANLYNMINKTEDSLELYYKLLIKSPDNPSILYNIAYSLKKLGKVKEALPFYQATLAKNPNHAEAQFSLGLLYLTIGDFDRGWPLYEWRWKRDVQLTPRNMSKPQWDGSDLTGKTILIHAEQGLGDTFQFIRYAKVIKEQYNARVVVAVQEALFDIISLCPYIDQLVKLSDYLPQHDVQVPLLTIPYVLKTTINTIPDEIPYLYADEQLESKWKATLATDTNFKIGICYQGNTKYSTPFLRAAVAAKSLPLTNFIPFSDIARISIYCLQKDTGTDQLDDVSWNLITFDDEFDRTHGRFMDTAAVMKNLDLIITVDTSIAHLAAGLGVPTWILIPNPADWRWMLDRDDTPWYPHVRLFRQSKAGDWNSVIENMVFELEKFMQQKSKNVQLTGKDLNKNTQQIESNSLITRLTQERNMIDNQIKIIYQHLRNNIDRDPQDSILIEQIRSFYSLNKLRASLNEQINILTQKSDVR